LKDLPAKARLETVKEDVRKRALKAARMAGKMGEDDADVAR